MRTEEAYHRQTGENGVGRAIHRTAELMRQGKDAREEGEGKRGGERGRGEGKEGKNAERRKEK